MSESVEDTLVEAGPVVDRRGFVGSVAMGLGLVAGYGLGACHFFRYLVPLGGHGRRRELFVGTLNRYPVGTTRTLVAPNGQEITIARMSNGGDDPAGGFRALSNKCPHLGCNVHFVAAEGGFYCTCHAGRFDVNGRAVSGPPAKEGKDLPTYEVRVDARSGWVFVMVSTERGIGV